MAISCSSTPTIDLVSQAKANAAQPIPDTELKSMLASYVELSNKLRQYIAIPTPQPVLSTPPLTTLLSHSNTPHSSSHSAQATHTKHEKVVSLRNLSFLHRREFKIQGVRLVIKGQTSATVLSADRLMKV